MTPEEQAVAALDALDGSDPESDHGKADGYVLALVAPEVREAYERASQRVGFWYA